MLKKGLVSVSFRNLSPAEIADLCTENGIEFIEWGSDIHAPCTDREKLSEIVGIMKKSGVSCSSYGTYFRLGVTPLSEFEGYIEAAKLLGTNILRFWCGDRNYEEYSDAERLSLLSDAKAAAELALERGVILCPECHNNTFTNTLGGALELMQTVNSSAMQMYWQPNQFRTVEENIEYATAISEYVKIIHVFNWSGKNKYPLAEGAEVWKKYLSCFDGSQVLLLEFMPDGKPQSLPTEYASLCEIVRCFE